MKRIITALAALLVACVAMSAQENLKQKAEADLQKMVGEWTYSMENPQGGSDIEGTATFTKDEGGIKVALTGLDDTLKSGYFTSKDTGKSVCRIPLEAYGMDLDLYVELKDGKIACMMDIGGMMDVNFQMVRKPQE